MEVVLLALVAGLTMVAGVVVLGRTIALLAEHNARLTYDTLRLMGSRGYQDFATGKRIELQADRLGDRGYSPGGPNPESTEASQKTKARAEWEQAFDSPHSKIDEENEP